MSGDGPSDDELLSKWREGDEAAGQELVRKHFDSIFRFFATKLGDDVSDHVQKTFLGLVEGKDRFRADAAIRTYLFAIARNVLRRHFEHVKKDAVDFSSSTLEDLTPSPSSLLRRKRDEALLVAALRRIPVEQQIALELRYWEGLTSKELSVVLDVPEPTARSRLRLGLEKVRRQLEGLDPQGAAWKDDESFEAWAESVRPEGA